jgi:hypothetical protein
MQKDTEDEFDYLWKVAQAAISKPKISERVTLLDDFIYQSSKS